MQHFLSRVLATTAGRIGAGAVLAIIATVIAVFATGGGGDSTESVAPTPTVEPTPEPTATPAATPTPAPTPTPQFVSPLDGLPAPERSASRRVLGVKVDNHADARPQSGIQEADLMVEIWVEGITRFLTLWQSSDVEGVGPIRSMRPTDFAVQNALSSTFVNSGGQGFVRAIGNASNVRYWQEPRPATYRNPDRYAPHNLYGDTEVMRALDDRGNYDEPLEPLFSFGEVPDGAADATEVVTTWPGGYVVSWSWNGESYDRTTEGSPHQYVDLDGNLQQLTGDTLIMLEMVEHYEGDGTGTSVPVAETTGSGPAWVFADGRVQQGTWSRESTEQWWVLTASDGTEMSVPPGYNWLVLPPVGGVSYR